jgi:hypothetical protein
VSKYRHVTPVCAKPPNRPQLPASESDAETRPGEEAQSLN